ncbi:hypothetical protein [Gemmatimonas sp. UBA7669]|uniref:hypothetical protein n=1 Tax=Gemmatimonas sp. UBA7669 TaxID=1946568 RepID=UPI0025C385FE|nr:hypothetical protein [Gemmatimonas sp. UBA7669]
MSFIPEVRLAVNQYVDAHLPSAAWYSRYFDFVADAELADRLSEEFRAARSVYKLLRGLDPTDWLQRAQVRMQVLQYASIYEAVIHHLLFDRFSDESSVRELVEFKVLKRISIPTAKLEMLRTALSHNGQEIIPTYQGIGRNDETKVRFDAKVDCAVRLGLLDVGLAAEIAQIYEARNAVHIHAELRKGLQYEIELARMAYRRMEPFRDQLVASLRLRGKLPEGGGQPMTFSERDV